MTLISKHLILFSFTMTPDMVLPWLHVQFEITLDSIWTSRWGCKIPSGKMKPIVSHQMFWVFPGSHQVIFSQFKAMECLWEKTNWGRRMTNVKHTLSKIQIFFYGSTHARKYCLMRSTGIIPHPKWEITFALHWKLPIFRFSTFWRALNPKPYLHIVDTWKDLGEVSYQKNFSIP